MVMGMEFEINVGFKFFLLFLGVEWLFLFNGVFYDVVINFIYGVMFGGSGWIY